jgi:hypothetical protein
MKDNTIVILVAEVAVCIFGAISLYIGNNAIATSCATAMVALAAGHLNGTHAAQKA